MYPLEQDEPSIGRKPPQHKEVELMSLLNTPTLMAGFISQSNLKLQYWKKVFRENLKSKKIRKKLV
jgi:hypothetical protein